MPTTEPLSEQAVHVRRTSSLCLSAASLALTLLSAVPLGLFVFDLDGAIVPERIRDVAFASLPLAIVVAAVALMLSGGLPRFGVPRAALPVRLGVAALLTAGACIVMLMMPLLVFIVSLLVGLMTYL
ncbi:hypothetical protein [Microbacterium sp. WCS2018Hpa-9]|uniref:hypothetical protein n=1 Tax=Microbacterium sp. WCS2018Hpa-9 TaxID=3073635 RepID=UPI00288B3A2E|nr:hypothetical protein [Microbacterium sp. WCS2018Hpa-9]